MIARSKRTAQLAANLCIPYRARLTQHTDNVAGKRERTQLNIGNAPQTSRDAPITQVLVLGHG